MAQCSCKDCKARTLMCHTRCVAYKKFRQNLEAEKEQSKKENVSRGKKWRNMKKVEKWKFLK